MTEYVQDLRNFWQRLVREHATPHEIALGLAAGVFAACTPFLGFQMALAALLAVVLRVNVPAALLGTFAGNPLSWPAIWGASYVTGAWVLGLTPAEAADHLSGGAKALGRTLAEPSHASIGQVAGNLMPVFEPLVIGGLMIGSLAAALSYFPVRRAVQLFQTRSSPH